MAYLTDKEKRLLFSALSREKEICKQVDKECCREPYEETLESVVESLEKKFYYDRFEKEIRTKTIEEFTEQLCVACCENTCKVTINGMKNVDILTLDSAMEVIMEVAKRMKGVSE